MEIVPRNDWGSDDDEADIGSTAHPSAAVQSETKIDVTICSNSNCPPNSIITDFKQGCSICTNCGTILPGCILSSDRPSSLDFEMKQNAKHSGNRSLPDTIIERNKILPGNGTRKKSGRVATVKETKKAIDEAVMNVIPASQRGYFVHQQQQQPSGPKKRYSERIVALGRGVSKKQQRVLRVAIDDASVRAAPPVIANRDLYHKAVDRLRQFVSRYYTKITSKVKRAYHTIAVVVCWQLLAREQYVLLPLGRLAAKLGLQVETLQNYDRRITRELKLPPWTKLDRITGECCHFFSFYPQWSTPERSIPSNTDLNLFVRYVFCKHPPRRVQEYSSISVIDSVVSNRIHDLRTGRIRLDNRKLNEELVKDNRVRTFAAVFAYLILRQRRNGFGRDGGGGGGNNNLVIESFCRRVGLKRITFQKAKAALLKWL